jgi:aminomethyltransferase
VYKHADDHLWMCTNGDERADYFADATKGLEVSIEYIAPNSPACRSRGPRSRELMRTITDAPIDELAYFTFFPEQIQIGGIPAWVSRTGFSGELGYEVFLRPNTPRRSGKRSSRLAPGPTAWRSSKRSASRPA